MKGQRSCYLQNALVILTTFYPLQAYWRPCTKSRHNYIPHVYIPPSLAHLSLLRKVVTRWRRPWSWVASRGAPLHWTDGCSSHCSRTLAQQLGKEKWISHMIDKMSSLLEATIQAFYTHSQHTMLKGLRLESDFIYHSDKAIKQLEEYYTCTPNE